MNLKIVPSILLSISVLAPLAAHAQGDVSVWLTNPDRSALFERQSAPLAFARTPAAAQVIDVDPTKTYQTMDGFGFALTGGSAQLIARMSPAKRAALLKELFADDGKNIGVSYLRLSVGSSDMNDHVFSYDDLAAGGAEPKTDQGMLKTELGTLRTKLKTDPGMLNFDLGPDKTDVVPVLKQILAIDPGIRILASPWSAPLWMKTTGEARGGVLKPEFFGAYAMYLVKYIEAMKAEGIAIDTLTIQNEPLNEKNTPSMVMLESEQGDFIKNHLGPAFQRAGIRTKIVLYDHNLDHPQYPLSILRDPAANKYVDGTGFHLYGGTVEAMTEVHNAFPGKNIYFTEQSVTEDTASKAINLSKPVAEVIIGVSRNWSRNILLWNLAADPSNGPHTNDGGCTGCVGAITIDGDTVTRDVAFYTLAHASKLVRPGSVRIGSKMLAGLPNVAFRTPAGKQVLIVSNISGAAQTFDVRSGGGMFTTSLGAGSVGTFVW